ncbi:MAG: lipid A phosphoethanolamine transferase [Muribaculaceae bacterium]|nr:lipid A phosphoethanolamine transferase [Muribaculaceae bacterium]
MKHSDTHTSRPSILPAILLWLTPLLLTVPNIALDITEASYSALDRAVNLLLPAGIYMLLMAAWRRNGITALCLLPVMVLCAFQIVLLFLYGESIIAVDMFLNVVTTNVHEAGELLRNLGAAIAVVCAIYLPLIALAAMAANGGRMLGAGIRRTGLMTGAALTAAGLVVLAAAFATEHYRPTRKLFPANVISNIFVAGERTALSENYFATSSDFRYGSRSTHAAEEPEVYVLVIGETSRADNWQLNGYCRPTTPRLCRREGLVSFSKALSESNTTHKSVPLMLSHLDCNEFGDSIYRSRGVIDAFAEAGYHTCWLSNQDRNGQLIDFFGSRADDVHFIHDDGAPHHDLELCAYLGRQLCSHSSEKQFVVLHTYGSHFNYSERYPAEYETFGHNPSTEASPDNRDNLIDAYDNTIVYADAVLDSIIATIESTGRPAAMLYLADHGEDIYDDSRKRFLHASPTPTYWQIHVPMLLWTSPAYRAAHPGVHETARANAAKDVSSSRSAFHTLLTLAGISSPYLRPEASLCSVSYREPERLYLNDYNEAVPLTASGLREPDIAGLRAHGISAR